MNRQPPNKTTKKGAGTKDMDLETSSPTGHEEVAAHIAKEAKGDSEVPKTEVKRDKAEVEDHHPKKNQAAEQGRILP